MDDNFLTIILAAGEGKRMASDMPKVLHPVAGLPMVLHVADTARSSDSNALAFVVGNQAERVQNVVQQKYPQATVHVQAERQGTGHAVLAARAAVTAGIEHVIILYGDVPLVQRRTILAAREALREGADIVVLGFETQNPTGYGRLIVEDGQLLAIREHKDASEQEREITLCNSGIMAFRAGCMLETLDAVGNDNSQNEYYLTDAAEVGRSKGLSVVAIEVPQEETLGVNDRVQLAEVEALWQERRRREMMLGGVAMTSPETVFFSHDTVVGRETVIEPNVVFAGGVEIADAATIRAFSHLQGAQVGAGAVVGPYARLRPGTVVGTGAKIGNFVETKATQVGPGAKINHLSYVGDAQVGAKANIGAGTITCNYDGFNKHRTTIGEGAFIGSNTSLVAPVDVGPRADTGAGSVITEDVAADDLAIGRARQANLPGKARQLRERNRALKEAK